MDIGNLRNEIDEVDQNIVSLINRRYELVRDIGQLKNKQGLNIYVPEREKALITRLEKLNKGLMTDNTLRAIYREIMSGAMALEKPLTIAFLGPEHTFSHQAAMAKFGRSVSYHPKNSIAEIFDDVEKDKVHYGVVPIENSTEGAVIYTLDMFAGSTTFICSEINLEAHQYLMGRSDLYKSKVIYSHPQAIGQCRLWLHEHLPAVPLVEVRSTAEAARRAAVEEGTAAIASLLAAEQYKLPILESRIEDKAGNITRFLVIGKQQPKSTTADKTSLMFGVKDKVGALYDCLSYFGKFDVNMSMIESRPSRDQNWEYSFFVDCLGHQEDENIVLVLKALMESCVFVRVLGSYPASGIIEYAPS